MSRHSGLFHGASHLPGRAVFPYKILTDRLARPYAHGVLLESFEERSRWGILFF